MLLCRIGQYSADTDRDLFRHHCETNDL